MLNFCSGKNSYQGKGIYRFSTAAALEEPIKPPVNVEYSQLLINGQFVDAASGETFVAFSVKWFFFLHLVTRMVSLLQPLPIIMFSNFIYLFVFICYISVIDFLSSRYQGRHFQLLTQEQGK